MSVLAFDALVRVHPAFFYAALAAVFGLGALAAKAAAEGLGLDVLLAPWGGRAWGLLTWALGTAFVYNGFRPLLPAKVFGVVYWPVDAAALLELSHLSFLAVLGAALWGVGTLAGAFDGWRPAPVEPQTLARAATRGAAVGAALGAVGASAARVLFIGEALSRLGFTATGLLLLWCTAPALGACGAFLAWLPAGSAEWEPRWRRGVFASVVLAWLVPVGAAELVLRAAWDFGRPGLSEAAGVPRSDAAEKLAVLVLAEPDGSPGVQKREEAMTAEGLAVTRQGLGAVRRYLELQGYRTVFLREALGYLRKGWALLWEPEMHMDAAAVRLGPRFPPDFDAFLKAVLVAPATPENYERLENVARAADKARSPSVKKAGKLYQGLSDAYARFGDLEGSNFWLKRIRKLWPLYEEDVNVDPVEDRHDGVVSGTVLFNGRPASSVQVGLFMQTSTTSAPSAREGLVASTWPDESGRFWFRELTPGRYYLALRSDPILLGDPRIEVLFSPGSFKLSASRMDWELMPLRIERAPSLVPDPGGADAAPPLPAGGAVPIPLTRG
ncbi:carboxypeptidase regulatory-like domain-containing protein [bacterium]|nr:MAG: carboxypeptidase regulatory-like domain-containing protein [bacterium]